MEIEGRGTRETRVAFIAHPPEARYVGDFFSNYIQSKSGLGILIKPFADCIGNLATKSFQGPKIKKSLFRKIATGVSEKGPLSIDKCIIRTEGGILSEEVYTMPFTTEQIMNHSNHKAVREWGIRLLELAKNRGAKIAGLGASVKSKMVTDSGKYFVGKVDGMYITNGNNNTAQVSVEGGIAAAQKIGLDLENLVIAVVGANGSVGRVCAEMATEYAARLILVGSKRKGSKERLEERAEQVEEIAQTRYGRTPVIEISTDLKNSLKGADLSYTATDSYRQVILPDMVRRGSVIVDIARPHDTGRGEGFFEKGVLVIDGGLQYFNYGEVHFRSIGTPPRYFLACVAEPLILAMAGYVNRDMVDTNIDDALLLREYSNRYNFMTDRERFRYHYQPISEEGMETVMRNAKG